MNGNGRPKAAIESPAKVSARIVPRPADTGDDLEWIEHPVLGRVPALPVPGHPTVALSGLLELPSGIFVQLTRATDDDYQQAAELSAKRLRRCKSTTRTWWWHTTVIAAYERRRRARLTALPGGAT